MKNFFSIKHLIKFKEFYIYSFILLFIIIMSIFPKIFSGYSPINLDFKGLLGPGNNHLAGTDFLGRDILSRTLAGARISLISGVGARICSIIFGTLIGMAAGLAGKLSKMILLQIIEIFLAIPALLLAMALAVVLGKNILTIIIAIAVGTWAPVARFVAVQINEIKTRDYVKSATVLGAGKIRIIIFYLLPALLPLLLPVLTTGIATSIMMEATLSFLGLGGGLSSGSIPSWGRMINEGVKFIFDAPWMIILPSIFLMLVIIIFNRLGDIIATRLGDR